ncbi:hypothetical protein DXC31_19455 [Mediterraneibacter gnavus]|uniref:Uncharacterized protein n=1 Tax=Mediterraneibacter gnavus TaxID=33038 RepID=A0A3E4ULE2_MEDGN|nr:hypothetical protein DXC31_19455 [Mediterraneibacter gnavus]
MKKLKIPRSLVLLIVFFYNVLDFNSTGLFQLQIVKGQEYENNSFYKRKEKLYFWSKRKYL